MTCLSLLFRGTAMLLPIVFYLFVVTAANPFHKYPYVFLLDVGNEELEKSNTEQIRISVPGGSLALRYPAVGDGDTIGHVTVSGIDFGTDLKANIVDGGPGYKYVVLVFMGNPGVTYDAVLTLQTVPNETLASFYPPNINYMTNSRVSDPNDSSEDFNDASSYGSSQGTIERKNAELTQSSSNVYRFAQNAQVHNEYNDEYEEDDSTGDDNTQDDDDYGENDDQNEGSHSHDTEEQEIDDSETQKYSSNHDYENNDVPLSAPDDLKEYDENVLEDTGDDVANEEDQVEVKRLFSNDIHNDGDKYKDLNNNDYVDSEDSFAVAY